MINRPIMISEARNLPHESFVILNGNIVNALPGGKNYTLRDSSGDITIEIGLKHWRGLTVGINDNVTIYGELKVSRSSVTIKVHAIAGSGRINNRPGQPVFSNNTIPLSEARNLPHDSFVILNGNIINSLPGGKNYTFRDSSGEIIVEIENKHWRGLSVGVSDRIMIYGEIKINRGVTTIKVHAISSI